MDFEKWFEKWYKKTRTLFLISLFLFIITTIIFIVFAFQNTDGANIAGILCGISFLFCLAESIPYDAIKRNPEKKKAELRAAEDERYKRSVHLRKDDDAARFYLECTAANIRNMDSEADRERLALLAKQRKILGRKEELIAAFKKGEIIVNAANKEERNKALKEKEELKRKENREYLEYFGRDKYIQICKDKILECRRSISECESAMNSVTKGGASLYQRERDWAVAGGIASGIAGGAAGVATAIDTQVRNAGVRANNQAVAALTFASYDQLFSEKRRAEANKKNWEEKLSRAERRLVEERSEAELFSLLDFKILEKAKSETGSVCVKFQINQRPIKIYGDVDAIVDGSLRIIIKNIRGEKTGEGIYVMREDLRATPEVICDPVLSIPEPFNVEFAPNRLWAIEKM